ncbi:hypothetical protein AAVH_28691 [Aphelenchoides avenae]|nr:hypothetical protein AAVH_28691 [Aphelenchus avenae]
MAKGVHPGNLIVLLFFAANLLQFGNAASLRLFENRNGGQPILLERDVGQKADIKRSLTDSFSGEPLDTLGHYSYMHDLFYEPVRYKRAIVLRYW